jgi:hypothetical protein
MFQQPKGNDIPDDPADPAVGLPDPNPGATPVMMPQAPGHEEDDALGTGTATGALSPVPSSSVAPSGMFARQGNVTTDDVTADDPGTDDRPADVGEPVPAAPQPIDVSEPAEFTVVAPLSITELEPTLAPGMVGSGHVVLPLVGPTGAGLKADANSDICFLDEVLYWVAFQRPPFFWPDLDGDDFRELGMSGYEVDCAVYRLSEEECQRIGIPQDPRMSFDWAFTVKPHDTLEAITA